MRKLFLLLALMAAALLSFGAVPEDQFAFVSHQDGSLIGLAKLSSHQTLEYSTDGISWNNMTTETTISLNDNVLLYVRGKLMGNNTMDDNTQFSITGTVEVKGNINYLWDYENLNAPLKEHCGKGLFANCNGLIQSEHLSLPSLTLVESCYRALFYHCINLTSAPNLPATSLANNCYRYMFELCEQLQTTVELPATTLADSCYFGMYNGCTSIRSAKALPATNLTKHCYCRMFRDCSNLTMAPELPATIMAEHCYDLMFSGCSSLVVSPNLPATTLAEYCYANMFSECTSLEVAPELPAIILTERCYFKMFYGDTSLVNIPELPATTLATNCYRLMFSGCTALTTTPELPATTLAEYCYAEMFYGCSNLTTAPSLPATNMERYCYGGMFYKCTNLTKAPDLPATELAVGCYNCMFKYCTNLTAAPVLPAATLADTCYNNMFAFCGSLNYIKCLATDISAPFCLNQWVNGVAASGTFVQDENVADWTRGIHGIPNGWTIESIQPYTINFDANGGLISAEGLMANTPAQQASCLNPDQKTGYVIVNSGEKTFSQLRKDCPMREGHTFLGWFTTKTGGIQVYDDAGIYVEGDNWDEDGRWIGTADLQLYAQWSVNSYTITWLQDDGSLIDKTVVPYDQIPTHIVPTKEPTAEFTYTFAGWAPEVVAVTDNATYIATYTATPIAEDIKNVTTTEKRGTKTIRNGQLFIQQGDKTYNAQGARVK